MKATRMLKQQHDKTKKLFSQLERAKAEDRRVELVNQLATDLAAHMVIEEQIFYPAARAVLGDAVMMDAALMEHEGAKMSLRKLLTDEQMVFEAKVKVLKELVEHHVSEEEEELFPKLEEQMEEAELKELGARLKVAFEEAVAAGPQAALAAPPPPPSAAPEVQVDVVAEMAAEEKPASRKRASASRANGRSHTGARAHARA